MLFSEYGNKVSSGIWWVIIFKKNIRTKMIRWRLDNVKEGGCCTGDRIDCRGMFCICQGAFQLFCLFLLFLLVFCILGRRFQSREIIFRLEINMNRRQLGELATQLYVWLPKGKYCKIFSGTLIFIEIMPGFGIGMCCSLNFRSIRYEIFIFAQHWRV